MPLPSAAKVPAYDPFGEPAEADCPVPPEERRVRVTAVVVFWTLALLLTAGRVYNGVQAVAMASGPAQVASLSITLQ